MRGQSSTHSKNIAGRLSVNLCEVLDEDNDACGLQIKNLGDGTEAGDAVTFGQIGTAVLLTSAGGDESIVSDGTGPSLEVLGLSEGTGITLSSDASAITITRWQRL